jgi:putative endonuclease
MYYFYILVNPQEKIYIGISKNPSERLKRHNQKDGAKYTKDHRDFDLVYTENFDSLPEARKREIQVKKGTRAKKLALKNRDIEKLRILSNSK